jgi:GAF domain-containing protein
MLSFLSGRATAASHDARELARLTRLHTLGVLDTEPDAAFDAVATAVAAIANTPIGFVSLVDEDRQWFKSVCGFDMVETPREVSFCSHTIQRARPMVIEDARLDPRFRDNPLVTGPPYVRFYAGFPLDVGDGLRVGSLCVLDNRPRTLTEEQMQSLAELAEVTSQWLTQYKARSAT